MILSIVQRRKRSPEVIELIAIHLPYEWEWEEELRITLNKHHSA